MKKINTNSFIVRAIIYAAVFALVAMALFPLFDFIIAKLFTHGEFHYTAKSYILEPAIFGVVFGIVWAVIDRKKEKKDKDDKE